MNAATFFGFALALSSFLWAISNIYQPRFAGRERVVMNWGFDRKPNSYASPRVALAVTPAIGTVVLLMVATLASFYTPQGQRMAALGALFFAFFVIAGIHLAHLHFAAKAE
jgi:hypothetical protein